MRRSKQLGLFGVAAIAAGALVAWMVGPSIAASGTPGSPTEGVPRAGHVFLIVAENTSLSELTAKNTPFLVNKLKPRAAWLTNYTALADGSLADYVGLTSGQFLRCDRNDALPYNPNTGKPTCAQSVDNLFHQLDADGLSWIEWNESMPHPCAFFDDGTDWAFDVYGTHHNPAVYYQDVEGGQYAEDFNLPPDKECRQRVLPMGSTGPNDTTSFDAALAKGHVPRFNMVIPNDCENGHDPCGTANPFGQFDAFLAREIPKIENSPAFGPNDLILITYDEWDDNITTDPHVGFIAVGGNVHPGVYDDTANHYSTLRTIEDAYGITNHLGGAATSPPLNMIWKK